MNKRRRYKTTLHTRNVPPAVKAQFKAWCARRSYTLEAAIIALMKKAVLENKPLPEARN